MNLVGLEELMDRDSIRLSCGTKWLIFDEGEWTVYQREPYQKKTRVLYRGESQEDAIDELLNN